MSANHLEAALRLQRLDDPPACPPDLLAFLLSVSPLSPTTTETWADAIDEVVAEALRHEPTSHDAAAALLELVAEGLDRDDQPRSDRADLSALVAVARYVRGLPG